MKPLDPRLLRHARAAAVYVGACVVVGTVTGGLLLLQAQLLASVVAGASGGWPIGVLAAVFAARAALLWVRGVLAQRSAARVKSTLRRRVVEHVVALGPAWLTGQRSGQLRTLVTQGIDALDAYFARYLPQLVLAVTVPVLVLCRLAGADVLSAVTVAVTLPLVPVFLALVGLATRRRSERRWRALAVLAHHFADVVAGLPTLRVFGRARAQAAAVRRVTDAYRTESLSALRWAFLSSMVLELLTTLAIALVAVEVGLRLVEGRLDLETGLLVLLLVPEAYLPLREVGAQFHASADGLAAAGELFAVLETPVPPRGTRTDVPDPAASGLTLEHLSFRYPDAAAPALDGVSFCVRPGEVVALTGPSGCGKSTLLSVLLGFRVPDEGRVLVGGREGRGGRPLAELDPDAWRRAVGWVPQRPYLLAGSVAENVRVGAPGLSDAAVTVALAAAGLAEVDPATQVGEGGAALSAGQRRRVALARALAREPGLLLLDEPTAGLDAATELAVVRAVRARGVTTLLVSHRPAVLAAADRVVDLTWRGPTPRQLHLAAHEFTWPLGSQSGRTGASQQERPSEVTRGQVKSASRAGVGVRLAGAVGLGAGAAGAAVALLATSGWLIVRAAERPPVLALMVAIVAVRAFGLGRAVLRYAERLVAHDAALRVLAALRTRVYARLAASARVVLTRRVGDVTSTVVADVDAVLDLLLRAGLPTAVSVLVAAGAVAAVAAFLPAAAWWLAGAVAVTLAGVAAFALRGRRAAGTVAPERGRLADAVTELLHGLPDLVANGAADGADVRAADERLRRAEARGAWSAGAGGAVVVLAVGIACCAALATGVAAVHDGRLDATHLAVVALVPLALADVLAPLPDAARHALLARAALGRLGALADQPRGVPAATRPTPKAPRGSLRLDGVRVRWTPDGPYVLDGVTLDIPAGRRVAVIGASGSGKSTLAWSVLGELPPDAGRVDAAGTVSLCGQDAYVFDSTVAENVRLARPDASDAEVTDVLTKAGLATWLANRTAGLDTRVGEHGDRLSGGERQRLALARALLADPAILVLDEPVEHLDEPTADAVMRDVLDATRGRTVLLLTHRRADLTHMDEVWRLVAGRLVPARSGGRRG